MIILMHIKYARSFMDNDLRLSQWALEARIPDGTPVYFQDDLPEEDVDGKVIFAFSVSGGETHYWTGEPITIPLPERS